MTTLEVQAATGSYPVIIEPDISGRLPDLIPTSDSVERTLIVADANTASLFAARLAESLPACDLFTVEPGEGSKDPATLTALWRYLASNGFHRGDQIIAVGGGVVTDLAGFAAATFHRGIRWVAMPTTLLGMVDAAIGGKTAIDIPEGKNLAGAFHPPAAVICDPGMLLTLPDRELRTGLAEVIKHGFIGPAGLLSSVRARLDASLAKDINALTALVVDAAAVKVEIVSEDETERGRRAHLNYGHTLAHALETVSGYSGLSHGEAVSIGSVFAARLARRLDLGDLVQLHEDAFGAAGLPTTPPKFDAVKLMEAMSRDKKYDRGLRFVLLEAVGSPVVVPVDADAVRAELQEWS
jgi:3-dehydroquinate synthase